MSNNDSVPGLMFPTQKGFPPGAGNSRDASIQNMKSNSELQTLANNSLSGGTLRKRKSYRRYKGGDANSTIVVPQLQMPYEPQGGPGTNPNNQIQENARISTQMAANSALDSGATKMGGTRHRRSRKGGNPDWLWGCMSGGKKCSRKKLTKKCRKTRKSRRSSKKHHY